MRRRGHSCHPILKANSFGKNCNSRRDAALHEVRRFERPRAAGCCGYDDDVGWRDRLVDDERPACSSEKRLPNEGNSDNGSRDQCDHYKDRDPPRPPGSVTIAEALAAWNLSPDAIAAVSGA